MLRFLCLLASLLPLSTSLADEATITPITLISYNIRNDNAGDKGPRDWQARREMVADYLLETWHPRTRPASLAPSPRQKWLGLIVFSSLVMIIAPSRCVTIRPGASSLSIV